MWLRHAEIRRRSSSNWFENTTSEEVESAYAQRILAGRGERRAESYMRINIELNRQIARSTTVLLLLTLCHGTGIAESPEIDRPDKTLRAHGVVLTIPGVVAALGSKDREVRRAAADVLTTRWPRVAAPALEQAISNEKEGFTRIWMAVDLARIGDPFGRKLMVKECHNMTESDSVRMDAAADLSDEFGDYSCLDVIFGVLQADSNPNDTLAKERALEISPHLIQHLSGQNAYKLHELVFKSLGDPWPGVRSTARMMLAQMDAAIANRDHSNDRPMRVDGTQNTKSKNKR